MITNADLPNELNLASWFVDRNVEEGRGDRTALIGPGGKTTYAELAGLVNRCGNLLLELGVRAGDRVLLVLADRPDLVHADRMAALEERHVDMPAAIGAGRTDFLAMGMEQAYCGSPAQASAEEGDETFETLTTMLVELIREVVA